MMHRLRAAFVAALLAFAPGAGFAQSSYPSPGGATVPLYLQGCLNGSSQAVPCGAGATSAVVSGTGASNADGVATASTGLVPTAGFNYLWNGTTWDRQREVIGDGQAAAGITAAGNILFNGTTWDRARAVNGAQTNGTGTAAVALTPTSAAGGGVPFSSTAALASNQVVCSAACNLYSFQVSADTTLSGAAWWVMIFNATAAPGDGAVTPAKCYALPTGTTSYSAAWPTPMRLGTGATIVVSTTGCFSKTASVHAFISGDAQQ